MPLIAGTFYFGGGSIRGYVAAVIVWALSAFTGFLKGRVDMKAHELAAFQRGWAQGHMSRDRQLG